MEVAPKYWQSPETLENLWVSTAGGTVSGTQSTNAVAGTVVSNQTASNSTAATIAADTARNQATNSLANSGRGAVSTGSADSTAAERMVPLAVFVHSAPGTTPLAVNHQGTFVATTISFNLAPNASLSQASAAIRNAVNEIGMPPTVHGSFQGTAHTFEESLGTEPVLILTALAAVYIVLGVLYESYIHPVTILSTLPSAGAGAVLALRLFGQEFSIIALIGVILLIGIVKKNAIMMIDFALEAQRTEGREPEDAIYTASLLRFRPIMMTTMAAMLGALPLAFGSGDGAELRQPLGISIVGGLAVSQVLTLYTTPVMYLYLDRFGRWCSRVWSRFHPQAPHAPPATTA
jgi:multidrug efflux pump